MTTPDPDRLAELGKRLDAMETKQAAAPKRAVPAQSTIAFRFATELVSALLVGGGLGWGIDWLCARFGFHTRPVFLIGFFILGAAAGIRNVMRAATEINAEVAAARSAQRRNEESGS